jgi:O-acetyl-ADP-ribose deacetylase (regulator of RNase III)
MDSGLARLQQHMLQQFKNQSIPQSFAFDFISGSSFGSGPGMRPPSSGFSSGLSLGSVPRMPPPPPSGFSSGSSLGSVPRMPPPVMRNSRKSAFGPRAKSGNSDAEHGVPVQEQEREPVVQASLFPSVCCWVGRKTFAVVELVADGTLKRLEDEHKIEIREYSTVSSNELQLCIHLQGKSADCDLFQGLDRLKELCRDTAKDMVTSVTPVPNALIAIVKTVDWRNMKTIMTTDCGVCVLVGLQQHVSKAEQNLKHLISNMDVSSSANEIRNTFITQAGQIISLKKGDITLEHVDIFVNAANDQLDHQVGIAKAICDSAGEKKFQLACRELIVNRGPLKEGDIDILVMDAGLLTGKMIIHAVAPRWSEQVSDERKKFYFSSLQKLCQKCLEMGNDRRGTSIAIPGIGSGIKGFPKQRCARALLLATRDFCKANPESCIKHIILIDMDDRTVRAFQEEARKLYGYDMSLQVGTEN